MNLTILTLLVGPDMFDECLFTTFFLGQTSSYSSSCGCKAESIVVPVRLLMRVHYSCYLTCFEKKAS